MKPGRRGGGGGGGGCSGTVPPAALAIVAILLPLCPGAAAAETNAGAPFESEVELQKMVLEPGTDALIVGGDNVLFRLAPDLSVEHMEELCCTFPNCHTTMTCFTSSGGSTSATSKPCRNQVMLLTLLPTVPSVADGAQQLLVCSNASCGLQEAGACELRSVANFSQALRSEGKHCNYRYTKVAGEQSVAVAVATPDGTERLLYVGLGHANTFKGHPISTQDLTGNVLCRVDHASMTLGNPHGLYNHLFVEAFGTESHVYFVFQRQNATRPTGVNVRHPYLTYVGRLCLNELNYYSYVEIPIRCEARPGGGPERLASAAWLGKLGAELGGEMALVVAFVDATGKKRSALCAFPLSAIDAKINETRAACYMKQKSTDVYLPYRDIEGEDCSANSAQNMEQWPCGSDHLTKILASRTGESRRPLLVLNNTLLTSVAVTMENSLTAAFLGDQDGILHKAYLGPGETSRVYGKLRIGSGQRSAINKDSVLDTERKYLYVLNTREVHRIPVQRCGANSSCQDCLALDDPYCGWCVLQGKCSRKDECDRGADAGCWVQTYENTRCPTIASASPPSLSIKQPPTTVALHVSTLPQLHEGDRLTCHFDSFKSPAMVEGTIVTCAESLPVSDIPTIPSDSDHVDMRVEVRYGEVSVAHILFPFYDCERAVKKDETSPCSHCVTRNWTCYWCTREFKCTHELNCPSSYIVSSSESCPAINGMPNSLMPTGVLHSVQMTTRNLNLLDDTKEVICTVLVENRAFTSPGVVNNNGKVTCKEHIYTYDAKSMEYHAEVRLELSDGSRIDNQQKHNVTLYDCSKVQTDCSECTVSDERYGCVWCADACLYNESCKIDRSRECPGPIIKSVEPRTGVLEGGTILTVFGSDLGSNVEQVTSVLVGSKPCALLKDRYRVSKSIVCTTGSADGAGDVEVVVEIANRSQALYKHFTYQSPLIMELKPTHGPEAGGTRISIFGEHLLTGNRELIAAFVGVGQCSDLRVVGEKEDAALECSTPPGQEKVSTAVTLRYGNATISNAGDVVFDYKPNPTITDFNPKSSFYGGGRAITVHGVNLGTALSMSLEVEVQLPRRRRSLLSTSLISSPCIIKLEDEAVCLSPTVTDGAAVQRAWFRLDGFRDELKSGLTYEENPVLCRPSTTPHVINGHIVTIRGRNLNKAMEKEEVLVFIGDEQCKVEMMDDTSLYCKPPLNQPSAKPGDADEKQAGEEIFDRHLNCTLVTSSTPSRRRRRDSDADLPTLTVHMGALRFGLGRVRYDSGAMPPLSKGAIAGIAVGLIVLLLAIAALFLLLRYKSNRAKREYEKILVEMTNMEGKVRDLVRREFADLVTDMSDLDVLVDETGVPFLEYHRYVERIFFPGQQQLLCEGATPESPSWDAALTGFHNLLNSKFFLIKFIHTLELQRGGVSQADRGRVASLITVVLHDKLEYYTDILKTQLLNIIDNDVEAKPKLLFRRTETVAEKMLTNWMSICLYTHLRETGGKPLYMLFKAIKYHVDKGPVDALMHKAKFTLDENSLLKNNIEHKELTINVNLEEMFPAGGAGEEAPLTMEAEVRVLDCDTVTQVKEKILDQVYRSVGHSQRPRASNLEIELCSQRTACRGLPLSDEDNTSMFEEGFRRINTLSHYKMWDYSKLTLVPRSQRHVQPYNQYPDNRHLAGERTSMMRPSEEEEFTPYHLIKAREEDEVDKKQRQGVKEHDHIMAIPEIYLTRLLTVKTALQDIVERVFRAILSTDCAVPHGVKYFLDFLDAQAERYGVSSDVLRIWKSNCLLLRFWTLLLKDPQLVFDVEASEVVRSSLDVISQTFMDACSPEVYKISKDAPTRRLLFAKEMPQFRKMVEKYYEYVAQVVPVSDQDMNSWLNKQSCTYTSELDTRGALHELYKYADKYYDQIAEALEDDPTGQLADRFRTAMRDNPPSGH